MTVTKLTLFFPFLMLISLSAFSQRTDLLLLKNGDWVTGEIKKLEYGVLTYKTDDVGTLTVKWKDVMKLRSVSTFELTTKGGHVFYRTLDTTDKIRQFVMVLGEDRIMLDMHELVGVVPIKNNFLTRVDGSIKWGFNYSKSSDVLTSDFSADITYRSFHDKVSLSGNSEITLKDQSDSVVVTKKQDMYLSYSRYFKNRWFLSALGGLEQNTGLGLRLRTYLGAGGGKELFQNHVNTLTTSIGLVGNREYATDGTTGNNLESAVLVDYRIYKYTVPKVILRTYLYTYPSITNPGRVRLNGNISVDFEFFKDFIFSITNYHNYDNKPASVGASTYDWGVTTSVGYTF